MTASPASAVASPCISVCQMHEATGWCEGCLRTIDEIAGWGQMADVDKRALLLRLGPRRVAWRARAGGATAEVDPLRNGPKGQA